MKLRLFIKKNRFTILSMIIGVIVAYFYWLHVGMYWGTYPLSSECWVNCVYGCLFGGLIYCIFLKKNIQDEG